MRNLPESCEHPKYNGRNLTNHVLVQDVDIGSNMRKLTYYCPAYLRLQIKNFAEMSFEDLEASINSVLTLTVNFRGIPGLLQQRIRPMLKLGFNRDDSLQIKQTSKSRAISMNMKEGGIYVYTIHKTIHVAMKQDVFLSPFQMIYLIMSVYIKDIQVNSTMIADVIEQLGLQIVKAQKEKNEKQANFDKKYGKVNIKKISQIYKNLANKNITNQQFLSKIDKPNEEEVSFILSQKMFQEKMDYYLDEEAYYESQKKSIDAMILAFYEQKKFLLTVETINFRFNFMDSAMENLKISYSAQGTYGNYDLAQEKLKVEYTNLTVAKKVRLEFEKRKKSAEKVKTKDQKLEQNERYADHSLLKPFNYAHFQIPLYKTPSVTLTTIFFPLWLLVIIMLGIYFQDTGLADRIGSLSGLMIAFVALIPVIRQQLPQSPNVTLVEVLVYMEIFTGLLCFIESVSVRNISNYDFLWYNNWLFLVSAIILGLEVLIIFVFMIIHKCIWQPSYNRKEKLTHVDFKYTKWDNINCDKHFRRKIDNYRVKIVPVDQKLQNLKQHIDKLDDEQKKQFTQFRDQEAVKYATNQIVDNVFTK